MEHSEKVDIVRSVYQYLLRLTGVIMILIGAYGGITELLNRLTPESARYVSGYWMRQLISNVTFLILGIPLLVLPGRKWFCRKSCGKEHTQ
ncbi:hypothetical protein HY632_00420 [Candidatus Uhrbacteria bacterium]|nr:hypothetical protein [Candidatus Uhrbacteria bacterium]